MKLYRLPNGDWVRPDTIVSITADYSKAITATLKSTPAVIINLEGGKFRSILCGDNDQVNAITEKIGTEINALLAPVASELKKSVATDSEQ